MHSTCPVDIPPRSIPVLGADALGDLLRREISTSAVQGVDATWGDQVTQPVLVDGWKPTEIQRNAGPNQHNCSFWSFSAGSAGEISPHPQKRKILGTFQGRRVVVAICRNMVEDYDKRPIKRPFFLQSRSIEHHRTALILTISPGQKWFHPVHTLTGLHFLRPNFHSVQTCEDWISTYECKGTKGYDQRLGLDFFNSRHSTPQSLQRRDYSRSCIFHCAYLTLEGDSWVITLLVENASEKEIVISSLAAAISVATKLHKYFIRWNMQYHSGSLHVVCRTAWQVIRRQYQFLLAAWYNVYMLSCIHTRLAMYCILCLFHLVLGVKHMSITLYNNRDMQWQTVGNTCNWFWRHLILILHMDV